VGGRSAVADSAAEGIDAYQGGVVTASDHPGRSGHAFKGARHLGRSAHGMPGGSASASAPLTSGPRVIENSELKTLLNENSSTEIARC
jgi:hypothetical protein